jgi:hypothetical protein
MMTVMLYARMAHRSSHAIKRPSTPAIFSKDGKATRFVAQFPARRPDAVLEIIAK